MAQAPAFLPIEQDETERAQVLATRYRCELVDLKNFRIQHDLFRTENAQPAMLAGSGVVARPNPFRPLYQDRLSWLPSEHGHLL